MKHLNVCLPFPNSNSQSLVSSERNNSLRDKNVSLCWKRDDESRQRLSPLSGNCHTVNDNANNGNNAGGRRNGDDFVYESFERCQQRLSSVTTYYPQNGQSNSRPSVVGPGNNEWEYCPLSAGRRPFQPLPFIAQNWARLPPVRTEACQQLPAGGGASSTFQQLPPQRATEACQPLDTDLRLSATVNGSSRSNGETVLACAQNAQISSTGSGQQLECR